MCVERNNFVETANKEVRKNVFEDTILPTLKEACEQARKCYAEAQEKTKKIEEVINYSLNLLTYDDLDEDEKIKSAVDYLKSIH